MTYGWAGMTEYCNGLDSHGIPTQQKAIRTFPIEGFPTRKLYLNLGFTPRNNLAISC